MSQTLNNISSLPKNYSFKINAASTGFILRPLLKEDVEKLAIFLHGFSEQTRKFFNYDSYDLQMAQELCDAINRFDKLRFVLEDQQTNNIVGIFEFSMDLVVEDIVRYKSYGYDLDPKEVCRYGPALADDYQGKGLASKVFELLITIIKNFDKKYIILFGGVMQENISAIEHYLKLGFTKVGSFANQDGIDCLDMIFEIN